MTIKEKREKDLKRVREIVFHMLEHPGLNRTELAASLGVHPNTLRYYLDDSLVLAALKGSAHKRVLAMIPLAVKGFEDSLKTDNEKIKYFASKDLLQTEKILGPERIDVTVQDNSNKTVEELQEMIRQAQAIPAPTLEAEIIDV